jgi:AcrR family transcriptional regulator
MTSVTGNARGRRARQRLLAAALESFAAHGFHGTSTRDIAEAAGLSAGALYAHYPTKEELLFELSRQGHRDIQTVVRDLVDPSLPPPEELRRIVAGYVRWHARAHVTARVVQYEMEALAPEHRRQIAAIRGDIRSVLETLIGRGMEDGSFAAAPGADVVALAILSLGVDVARWYREGGRWTAEEIGSHYAELSLRMVGAHPT